MDTDPLCLERAARALACVESAPAFLLMGMVIGLLVLVRRPTPAALALIGGFYCVAGIHIVVHTVCFGTHMQVEYHGPYCRGDSPDAMWGLSELILWWMGGAAIAAATAYAGSLHFRDLDAV